MRAGYREFFGVYGARACITDGFRRCERSVIQMNESKKLRLKKILSLVSVAIVLGLLVFLTWFFTVKFKEISNAESFKEYILSFGAKGMLVGLGFQVLQVFVALIPGEVIEIGLGYAFGAIRGTLLCYGGLALASAAVFLLVKKFGLKVVELFISEEKLKSMRFIKNTVNNPDRLKKLVFVLFFIPGTPKDLFTYFLGLTPLTLGEFLSISMIARIPSVVSSTVGGMLIHNRKFVAAGVLFAITALLSVAGWFCYEKYSKRSSKKS